MFQSMLGFHRTYHRFAIVFTLLFFIIISNSSKYLFRNHLLAIILYITEYSICTYINICILGQRGGCRGVVIHPELNQTPRKYCNRFSR